MACDSCDHSDEAWELRAGYCKDLVHALHTAADVVELTTYVSDALAWVAFYARHDQPEHAAQLATLFDNARRTAINGWSKA